MGINRVIRREGLVRSGWSRGLGSVGLSIPILRDFKGGPGLWRWAKGWELGV